MRLLNLCFSCKKPLSKRTKTNKTGCCKLCSRIYKDREKLNRKLECKVCKIIFMAIRKTRVFCSDRCASISRSVRYKKPELFNKANPLLQSKGGKPRLGEVKECKRCGKEKYFGPCFLRSKNYFCSRKCLNLFQKENANRINCVVCKISFLAAKSSIRLRARKTCSKKCRSRLLRMRAEKRRSEGRYTQHQLDRLARNSPELKGWRKLIFTRDNYTCQECGIRGGYLEADHIKPFAFFPDLRYVLSNGRTLCRPCHNKTKMSASKMREIYLINS